VSDTALGMFPPLLTSKATDGHAALVVVDRFFPSSQIHHGCGGRLLGEKLAKQLSCERCGAVVDRDENAAKNIRDWPDPANPGPVEASALREPGPPDGGTDGRSDVRGTVHRARRRKTSLSGVSVRREPMLANASGGTPQGVHLHDHY
jgi:transposase